jgi:hypothetical protein
MVVESRSCSDYLPHHKESKFWLKDVERRRAKTMHRQSQVEGGLFGRPTWRIAGRYEQETRIFFPSHHLQPTMGYECHSMENGSATLCRAVVCSSLYSCITGSGEARAHNIESNHSLGTQVTITPRLKFSSSAQGNGAEFCPSHH